MNSIDKNDKIEDVNLENDDMIKNDNVDKENNMNNDYIDEKNKKNEEALTDDGDAKECEEKAQEPGEDSEKKAQEPEEHVQETAEEEDANNAKSEKTSPTKKSWKRIILEDLAVLIVAIFVGLGIRNFAMPVRVCGHSMESTLKDGDFMIMNRLSYAKATPNHGDVIVTKSGLENGKRILIKRVIGVPGDKIVVKDGHVYRNGKLLNESYIKEDMLPTEFVTEVVPEGQVFVMGDNRNDSLDSRSPSVGTLSIKDNLLGKCYFDVSQFKTV